MRDKKHLQRVASLWCVAGKRTPCGIADGEPAHHPRGLKYGCGTSLKAGDEWVVKYCNKHHDRYHKGGRQTFEAAEGTHEEHFLATCQQLRNEGYTFPVEVIELEKLVKLELEYDGDISALEEEFNRK